MTLVAVPNYVTQAAGDFADCPAGHRFNLYFPVWDRDWKVAPGEKAKATRKSCSLGCSKKVLTGLAARQGALAAAQDPDECLVIDAISTSPFATGLGIEHPIENGFAFLSPYGLPYLAGSGVKGVLRHAAEELHAMGALPEAAVERLFGHDDANDARRGALSFWDVFPVPPKNELVVEVMTPHFGDYYQKNGTPNDAGRPNPIPFLAVPAKSAFRFVLVCDMALLGDALTPGEWKEAARKIIAHAFEWLGFGAKTSVGYGAVQEDMAASARREEEAGERVRRNAMKRLSANLQKVAVFVEKAEKRHGELRGGKIKPGDAFMNEFRSLVGDARDGPGWSADEKLEVFNAVSAWLEKIVEGDPKEQRKKLKLAELKGTA